MKLFIIGHGRHGKDTVADQIRDNYGLTFQSSSLFCAEHVVRPYLVDLGIVYPTLEACYDDRANHREDWYQAIRGYNEGDEAKLSRAIFSKYDMYVGIRSRVEYLAAKHLVDLTIWVDAFERVPAVDPTCKVLRSDCDIVIDNNGTEAELKEKVARLFNLRRSYE